MKAVFDAAVRALMWVGYRLLLVWWTLRRPVIHGAYVAVWHGDEILLIKNSYRRGYSLPAGGLHRGEDARAAAQRELREEVGIDVPADQLEYVGEIVAESGPAEDHAHFFELRAAEALRFAVDRREVVWAGYEAPAQALQRRLVGVVRKYLEERSARV